jgi:hypothetical protein
MGVDASIGFLWGELTGDRVIEFSFTDHRHLQDVQYLHFPEDVKAVLIVLKIQFLGVLPNKGTIRTIATGCFLGCGWAGASGLPIQQMVVPSLKWYEDLYDAPGQEAEAETSEAEYLSDLSLKVATAAAYDSNVGQAPDTAALPAQGDFFTTFTPSLRWSRENSVWNVALDGSLGYDQYVDLDQFSGLDYGSAAELGYRAGRLELGANFRQSFDHAVNRFYGAITEEQSYATALSAIYVISPKTALVSVWQSAWTEPGSGFGGTEQQSASFSALWRYSQLLQVGPGLGLTRTSGELQSERTSQGPTLSAVYQLSEKVDLNSQVGMDSVDYGGGGTDEFFSARVGLKYVLNPLWGFDFSLVRDAEADGSLAGGFRETTGMKLGVMRNIRRVTLRVGLGYDATTFVSATDPTPRPPLDYFTGDVSLAFPVMAEQLSGAVFFSYKDSASNEVIRNWESYQIGVSLIYRF